LQIAGLAGPCEVIARAEAHDVGELAKQITWGPMPPRRDTHDELPVGHCEEPIGVDHCITIDEIGEGGVQAVCSCGWQSPVFGSDKTTGTMDPLQTATDAGDLHEWDMSLR
jgi:hypothetical protein